MFMEKKTVKFVSPNCSSLQARLTEKPELKSLRVRNESEGGGGEEKKGKSRQEVELMDRLYLLISQVQYIETHQCLVLQAECKNHEFQLSHKRIQHQAST